MNLKLIAIDMDATLLRDDKTYDRTAFNQAVQILYQRGVRLTIASGNSFDKLDEYIDDEIKHDLYFSGDNGNHIVKNGETLAVKSIELADVRSIVNWLHEKGGYYPVVSTTKMTYSLPSKANVASYLASYNPHIKELQDFVLVPATEPIVKLAVMAEHPFKEIKQTVAELNQTFPQIAAVTSGGLWLDVYHKLGGKGAALSYLQDKYQITPAQTLAFGDSLNDYTMMQAAAYSVAMGNADPDLCEVCQYQIGTNNDSAVIKVLQALAKHDNLNILAQYQIH